MGRHQKRSGPVNMNILERETRRLKQEKNALHYAGIAADQAWRCKGEIYPLVDWGVTENKLPARSVENLKNDINFIRSNRS